MTGKSEQVAAVVEKLVHVHAGNQRCRAFLGSNDNTRWGGVVGAGLEYGFAPNWSLGFEYDHLFMDRQTVSFGALGSDSIKQDADLFTARLNYRFGGAVATRY